MIVNSANEDLIDRKVLHVPLGASLPMALAKQWRIEWHCCAICDDVARVVPRLIDGQWSQGAIVLVDTSLVLRENSLGANIDDSLESYKKHLVCLTPPPSSPSTNNPFVDLLQNKTLLRALLRVRVVVQVVPSHHIGGNVARAVPSHHICDRKSIWKEWKSNDGTLYRAMQCRSGSGKPLVYDVKASNGATLSAQQLLRASKRNSANFSLLPLLTKDNETLYTFVTHNEQRLQFRQQRQLWQRRYKNRCYDNERSRSQTRSSVGDSNSSADWRARSTQRSAPSIRNATRSIEMDRNGRHEHIGKQHYYDVDDATLNAFAQRLLRLVDEIVPSDAIGVIVRPFDLEATAFIEQQCPYMLCKSAAFVPALSRIAPCIVKK